MKEFKNEAQNKINHQQQNKQTNTHSVFAAQQKFACITWRRLSERGESHVLAADSRKNFVITREELRGAPAQKELSDKNN